MDTIGQHPVLTTDKNFQSLGLSEATLKLLNQIGFQHPTPIQSDLIPPALLGRDLIGLAQTGSGKTAAFVIPIAERLQHGEGVRGLVLSPTREIALQTKAFLDLFGRHHELMTVCLIGGVPIRPQIKDLRRGPDVIVATPGRLLDHLNRGTISLNNIEELVFDEADHMLDLGFLPQIKSILKMLPKKRHTMMFSATMPYAIEQLAQRYLNDPLRIDILPEGKAAEGITHRLYLVNPMQRKDCLLTLLNKELGSTLVFTQTRREAHWLYKTLFHEGHPVIDIHSDKTQKERVSALEGFRSGEHRILVATAIASRGIDVQGIKHIVNFDIPETVEEYIHRAGRTARGDAKGLVSTIATFMDLPVVKRIEAEIGQEIPRCSVAGIEPFVETQKKAVQSRRLKSRW
ncbi:MAG: DEAD/DEAH box helicase [bacterium]|nr:DEAD/DEAH box helicase [bacterium]MBU1916622.1 DEAD/DEAH box helicase [bacterium]